VRNLELNGAAPDAADLHRLTAWNYGHFTSMQVRGFAVRGFALHLARLADANTEFFGYDPGLDDEHRLRQLIRQAMRDEPDASVRVSYLPAADPAAPPEVVVSVTEAVPDAAGPALRVRTDDYRREWPAHKHVATMGLTVAWRRARGAGFDDALFVGRDGLVSEGTTWNAAFFDGDRIVWPQAPMLKGVTMVLLQLALSMNGTPWTLRPVDAVELPLMTAAAAVNSICPAQPIGSVDGVPYDDDGKLAALLRDAWDSVPFEAL
jgi:branched-subunit amino acid aminotransferase/4-amino-4-deoxychorismate lyase